MHFRFVTYRWGADLLGGAELHHRRLAQELLDLGHEVSVATTTGRDIRTLCHWAVEWSGLTKQGDDDFRVTRVPLRRPPRWLLAAGARYFQRRFEVEERRTHDRFLETLLANTHRNAGVHLLSGWHYPEVWGGATCRWTHEECRFSIQADSLDGCSLFIGYHAPKPNSVMVSQGAWDSGAKVPRGQDCVQIPLDGSKPGLFTLSVKRAWRPVRDFRTLGMLINSLVVINRKSNVQVCAADMGEDYRSLGRLNPELWQDHLLERCQKRPSRYGWIIDLLRGPSAPGLGRAARSGQPDHIIHCNLPWANVGLVKPGDLAMPLWHIEDEFYYWKHWVQSLKRSRFVLANTPYTAKQFYPKLGVDAYFVGPPIWAPEVFPTRTEAVDFRHQYGIEDGEVLVLAVCRKSGEKRYEAIAQSVARLRERELPIGMIGVGPDADGRAFDYPGCQWIGRLTGQELQAAYAACGVFVLMSESESFGMVIPEAWHHGKPVIVNRACGPAASLVADGVDGMLALPGRELDEALEVLALSSEKRQALGGAGRDKAREHYVRGASGKRLLAALE